MNKIKPSKEAMLVCDSIITEVGTNKKSLIGIFEDIASNKFPFRHESLSVYIKFTGAMGEYVFRLELVELHTNESVGQGTVGPLNISDKLGSYELVFNLKGIVFKNAGKYEFRIYANDEIFGVKSFNVVDRPTPTPQPPNPPKPSA